MASVKPTTGCTGYFPCRMVSSCAEALVALVKKVVNCVRSILQTLFCCGSSKSTSSKKIKATPAKNEKPPVRLTPPSTPQQKGPNAKHTPGSVTFSLSNHSSPTANRPGVGQRPGLTITARRDSEQFEESGRDSEQFEEPVTPLRDSPTRGVTQSAPQPRRNSGSSDEMKQPETPKAGSSVNGRPTHRRDGSLIGSGAIAQNLTKLETADISFNEKRTIDFSFRAAFIATFLLDFSKDLNCTIKESLQRGLTGTTAVIDEGQSGLFQNLEALKKFMGEQEFQVKESSLDKDTSGIRLLSYNDKLYLVLVKEEMKSTWARSKGLKKTFYLLDIQSKKIILTQHKTFLKVRNELLSRNKLGTKAEVFDNNFATYSVSLKETVEESKTD